MEAKHISSPVYEDGQIIVLDKPAGMDSEHQLPAALRELWGNPEAFVGLVHRLDAGVSGLMVCAKTPKAAAALSRQVQAGTFRKEYRAVIAGGPDEALPGAGQLRDYLFKDSRAGRVYPVKRLRKGVREAVLNYRILDTREGEQGPLSLVEIQLETGRTHQIRVHMAWLGHPLLGDPIYGTGENPYFPGLALHCAKAVFLQPFTGEKVVIQAPPEGWNEKLKEWVLQNMGSELKGTGQEFLL